MDNGGVKGREHKHADNNIFKVGKPLMCFQDVALLQCQTSFTPHLFKTTWMKLRSMHRTVVYGKSRHDQFKIILLQQIFIIMLVECHVNRKNVTKLRMHALFLVALRDTYS